MQRHAHKGSGGLAALSLVALSSMFATGALPAAGQNAAAVATAALGPEGFARQMSWNRGQTATFSFSADVVRASIYQMGTNGLAGRLVASIPASRVQQPACLVLPHGSADCGNWAVSARWSIPASASSSIYRAVPDDATGAAGDPIPFVVRCDECGSDIVVVTSDATWQAYNPYGGGSLYKGNNPLDPAKGREFEVSYNRPIQGFSFSIPENSEYPLLNWLTANRYSFQYVSQLDLEATPRILMGHHVVMTVGHLEYVSRTQRMAVQDAINAGENFFNATGNDFYWKTDSAPSIDAAREPYRTIVCYKETIAGADINPSLVWTGTWRDRRFSPPNDGGQPENTLTGQMYTVDVQTRNDSIQFTAQEGQSPFLRNTVAAHMAAGKVLTMPAGTLGYEWNEVKADLEQLPANELDLSTSVVKGVDELQPDGSGDYSVVFWSPLSIGVHHVTVYQAPSGALVFSAGSVQWSWGLSDDHARYADPTANAVMEQATMNMLTDMGAAPGQPQAGLIASAPQPFSSYQASLAPATAPVIVGGEDFPSEAT